MAVQRLAPIVEADPERLQQAPRHILPENQPNECDFGKLTGFSEAQLKKDPRFRLSVALQGAGKYNTDAGRVAMLKANVTANPARRANTTSSLNPLSALGHLSRHP